MGPLRVVVLGAGHLGKIHARLLSQRSDAQLTAIVDPLETSLAAATAECRVPGYPDVADVAEAFDAAIIATPTQYHYAAALPLVARGVHCLIEKPITLDLAQADELIAAARSRGVVLQVGHVERFNPALVAARDSLRDVRYIECVRTSGYAFRSIDIGVVLDLMIHDLDIVLSLIPEEVVDVRAVGTAVLGPHEDMAQARLEFASGAVANLSASRTSFAAQRTVQAVTPDGFVWLDLANRQAKTVHVSERVRRGGVNVLRADAELVTAVKERLFSEFLPLCELSIPGTNAIAEEHSDFIQAIRSGESPRVPGEAGRRALAVAQRIIAAIAQRGALPRRGAA